MPKLALALLCMFGLLALPGAAEEWPMFHRDAQRSGVSGEAWSRHDLSVAWAVPLDDESVDASPAVVAGHVYVGTATGKVVCVTAESGAKVWEAVTDGAVRSSPAVSEGRVFVGSVDRCLYAFDATTGKLLWRVRTGRPVVAPPVCEDGRVYCGGVDGVFRCMDATTGAIVWECREAGEISGGAAIAAGTVFYGDEAGNVLARSCADGKLLWSIRLSGEIIAAPTLAGARLIVPVMSGTALSPPPTPCITVLDKATGAQQWAIVKGSSVMQTPIADEQYVYFATVSGYLSDTELFACRLEDGAEIWKRRLGGVADCSPLLAGSSLLFGTHDRSFYVVDKASGVVAQGLPLGGKMFSSPALSEGAIYIGAQDGKLYCLK